MPKQILVLSGPVASGKTTLLNKLKDRYAIQVIKTWKLIQQEKKGVENDRAQLQRAGDELDRKTGGEWLADAVARAAQRLPVDARIAVDAVRIKKQIDALRRAFGSRVVHIHLTASEAELARRYGQRSNSPFRELSSYSDVLRNKTERGVRTLAAAADVVVDTERCTEEDVVVRVASTLGFYGKAVDRLVDVLVGGQYGSEGKGHIASYLGEEYDYLVRSGGPNAGHQVYEEPTPYTHHQLPSGTRCSGARLIIAPGAVLHVEKLLKEIAECIVGTDRLSIDPQAMIIEQDDVDFEATGLRSSIGSTAQGVGAATSRKILRTSAKPRVRLAKDVLELKPFIKETLSVLESAFAEGKRVFVEGTQGTGLSMHHGSYPYVTSRETSVSGCLAEAGIAPTRVRRIVVVVRSYPIRVQNPDRSTSGPMDRELSWEEVSRRSGVGLSEIRTAEKTSTTRRDRRVAEFSWSLLRKSVSLNGPTDIALTFVDYISITNRKARRFDQLTEETRRFIQEIERVAGAPVSLVTTRFDYRSILDRRTW
jgi:adenylosuccinate synthase